MSTTLTNGLKLPDKGSVDWYADMQNNYQILDGAVGTIAEHTSALSGKASLVHTHTKSDITDLFNSANTWTDTNTYTVTGDVPIKITNNKDATNPSATEMKDIRFSDVNGKIIGGVRHSLESGGTSKIHLYSRSFSLDGSSNSNHGLLIINNKQTGIREIQSESNFIPSANNSYDLGSSGYQWNNLYANNYYYNGVAWGLDKENTWSKTNYFSSSMYQKVFTARASIPSSNEFGTYIISDSNNAPVMLLNYANRATGVRDLSLRVYDYSGNTNGVMVAKDANNNYSFCSTNPNDTINLGTSTNKWKTLNGTNPGALSLPSSHYVSIDTTGWDLTGATYNRVYINNANPTFPGILFIRINSSDPVSILVRFFSTSGSEIAYSGSKMEAGSNNMIVTVPCPPNTNIYVQIETTSTITACRYYTLLGDPEFNSRSSS